jgi:pimeloyl-ACP methyl ester carboxylesterase
MRRNLPCLVLLILMSAVSLATPPGMARKIPFHQSPVALADSIRVGSVTLKRCLSGQAYCGSIERAFDPTGQVSGNITISFEFYPHTDSSQSPLEPIVAAEGGPGYATTGSASGYLALFAPLRDRRDMLFVDNRGTGKSEAINCPLLEKEPNPRPPGVNACGTQLGDKAYLYDSGLAADDLAALLDAMNISVINLYGDSYGTWFSQTFAGRHPERLRSLILDSAYPVRGQSPWYPEIAPTARFAFNAACERSLTCANLPGTSRHRIELLLASLRANPFSGYAHDGSGVLRYVHADATALNYLMVSNATTSVVYRELDPAARAYLEDANTGPLVRLLAENYEASTLGTTPYTEYSQGLFVSVSCSDYPQIYDMTLSIPGRKLQRDQAIAREQQLHPKVYAPFTIEEFAAIPLDTSVLDLCLHWPAPVVAPIPPGQPVPSDAHFTKAPVLVLSGDLDSLTPASQAKHAAMLFENGHQVIFPNSFHVTADGDEDNCASVIAVRFQHDLDPGDTSCTEHIAEVHVVPKFVATAAEVAPAMATAGNKGSDADLRISAAAAYTAGDALARWWVNATGAGVGLLGGRFQYNSPSNLTYFLLDHLKWVEDLKVSGTMKWDYVYPGAVIARLTITGSSTEPGELTITWNSRVPLAEAIIIGHIGGRKIAATMYAP